MLAIPSVTAIVTASMIQVPLVHDVRFNPGAIFVYLLLAAGVWMVLHFGLKKPKGPGSLGHG